MVVVNWLSGHDKWELGGGRKLNGRKERKKKLKKKNKASNIFCSPCFSWLQIQLAAFYLQHSYSISSCENRLGRRRKKKRRRRGKESWERRKYNIVINLWDVNMLVVGLFVRVASSGWKQQQRLNCEVKGWLLPGTLGTLVKLVEKEKKKNEGWTGLGLASSIARVLGKLRRREREWEGKKERSCSAAWSGSRVFNHPREEWDRGEGRQRRDSFCNVSNPELFLVNRPKEVVFAVLWISASLHIHTTTQSWYEEGELGEEKEEAWGRISCDVDLILLPPLLLLLLLLPPSI